VTMGLLLLIVLILFLVGGLPNSGNHSYGCAPSGLAEAGLASIDQNQQTPPAPGLTDRS